MAKPITQTVDVVVPCYNYGRYLRVCVRSLLEQSGVSVRVLIINDASPDSTGEIASDLANADPRITYFEHSVNKGHIYTYNEGIEWACADYFLLLSADDYLLPGALERAASLMQRHPNVGFTFGAAFELYEDGKEVLAGRIPCNSARERILSTSEFVMLCGHRNIVPTPTAILRTQLQKQVGGYDRDLPHAGDMEMWLRLAAFAPVGFIGLPQAVYRRHAKNMSLSYADKAYRRFPDVAQRKAALDRFFEKYGKMIPNARRTRRNLVKQFALEATGFASEAFNAGEPEIVEEFSRFALQTYPEIKRSWAWTKLGVKRRLGRKLWSMVRARLSGAGPVLGTEPRGHHVQ